MTRGGIVVYIAHWLASWALSARGTRRFGSVDALAWLASADARAFRYICGLETAKRGRMTRHGSIESGTVVRVYQSRAGNRDRPSHSVGGQKP